MGLSPPRSCAFENIEAGPDSVAGLYLSHQLWGCAWLESPAWVTCNNQWLCSVPHELLAWFTKISCMTIRMDLESAQII